LPPHDPGNVPVRHAFVESAWWLVQAAQHAIILARSSNKQSGLASKSGCNGKPCR